MEKTRYFCAECGKEIKEDNKPCPDCGSTKRHIESEIQITAKGSVSVGYKVKDPSGTIKFNGKSKPDVWKKYQKPVQVTIDKDHTHPEYTEIRHKVEEVNESGEPAKTIHEDVKWGKSKHRSRKDS